MSTHLAKELSHVPLHEHQRLLFNSMDIAVKLKKELEQKQKEYDLHMQNHEYLKTQMYRILEIGRTLMNEYSNEA